MYTILCWKGWMRCICLHLNPGVHANPHFHVTHLICSRRRRSQTWRIYRRHRRRNRLRPACGSRGESRGLHGGEQCFYIGKLHQ